MSTLLLISPDKDLVKWASEALSPAPVTVEAQPSLKGAMEFARHNFISIVLVDLFLGEGVSGFEALTALKKNNDQLIFVLLSRVKNRSFLERAFRHGASDVLTYPVAGQVLLDTVLHRLQHLPDPKAAHEVSASES